VILAGDIGGTKTVLALFDDEGDGLDAIREEVFPSREHASLEEILRQFLAAAGRPALRAACLGVAGPVMDGRSRVTNLPWEMDERTLGAALEVPRVRLLNDLEAAAHGMLGLPPEDLCVLQGGRERRGHMAVIAAGTGLGEALLIWDGARHAAVASEGGHADFAPRDDLEIDLLRFLRRDLGRVSYERVLSGPGLLSIYRFLRDRDRTPEPAWIGERMAGEDPGAVISEVGLAGKDPVCARALDMFVAIYGAAAGNLALTALTVGGVFVGGGIAPKIRPKMADGTFVAAFRAKGRFSPLMESIPVRLALNPRAPLFGAARVARDLRAPETARPTTA